MKLPSKKKCEHSPDIEFVTTGGTEVTWPMRGYPHVKQFLRVKIKCAKCHHPLRIQFVEDKDTSHYAE